MCMKQPVASSFSNLATIQGILLNYRQGKNWIAEKFINFLALYDDELRDMKPHFFLPSQICLGGNYLMYTKNIFVNNLENYALPHEMVSAFGGIISFCKGAILHDCYVNFFVNRSYISATNVSDSVHETFVYGFDDDKAEIYIMDYFNGKPFSKYHCSYDEIEKAYENCDRFYYVENKKIPITGLTLTKYVQRDNDALDIEVVKGNLENYLNAVNLAGTITVFHSSFDVKAEKYWGIKSYEAFEKYFLEYSHSAKTIDFGVVRNCHHLLDHKNSLLYTVRMLNDLGMLDNEYGVRSKEIADSALILRNRILKYQCKKERMREEYCSNALARLRDMKLQEEQLINSIIGQLGRT